MTNGAKRIKKQEVPRNEAKPILKFSPTITCHIISAPANTKELTVKKISVLSNFQNFDETQHLNGCPVKWLYNKKIMEMNKTKKSERWCSKKSPKKEENTKERNKHLRDKTPAEVKIHKINLTEKYTSNYDEKDLPKFRIDNNAEEVEARRKKLAAKLNWKLHDEPEEKHPPDTSSEISSRHNYLPPRPLLGLKPLLSIMLSPSQHPTCCSGRGPKASPLREEKTEASLTIQSLDFPLPATEPKPRPKTTFIPRCARSTKNSKKLQIPNQITINLKNQKSPRKNQDLKVVWNPVAKKNSEKTKQTKSLSTLFYELKDKSNQNEEIFEEMIQNLTMDDDQYKIKRFFNFDSRLNSAARNKLFRKKNEVERVRPLTSNVNLCSV